MADLFETDTARPIAMVLRGLNLAHERQRLELQVSDLAMCLHISKSDVEICETSDLVLPPSLLPALKKIGMDLVPLDGVQELPTGYVLHRWRIAHKRDPYNVGRSVRALGDAVRLVERLNWPILPEWMPYLNTQGIMGYADCAGGPLRGGWLRDRRKAEQISPQAVCAKIPRMLPYRFAMIEAHNLHLSADWIPGLKEAGIVDPKANYLTLSGGGLALREWRKQQGLDPRILAPRIGASKEVLAIVEADDLVIPAPWVEPLAKAGFQTPSPVAHSHGPDGTRTLREVPTPATVGPGPELIPSEAEVETFVSPVEGAPGPVAGPPEVPPPILQEVPLSPVAVALPTSLLSEPAQVPASVVTGSSIDRQRVEVYLTHEQVSHLALFAALTPERSLTPIVSRAVSAFLDAHEADIKVLRKLVGVCDPRSLLNSVSVKAPPPKRIDPPTLSKLVVSGANRHPTEEVDGVVIRIGGTKPRGGYVHWRTRQEMIKEARALGVPENVIAHPDLLTNKLKPCANGWKRMEALLLRVKSAEAAGEPLEPLWQAWV